MTYPKMDCFTTPRDGDPGLSNEAFASHYLDHWIARHPDFEFVLMSRPNRVQDDTHPWVAHGCIEGSAAFATDLMQVLGPTHRGSADISCPFGTSLPSRRLQHEAGCASLRSREAKLAPGASTSWTFFAFFRLKVFTVLERRPRVSTARIEALIEAMTIEEKIGQLIMTAVGLTVTGPVVAADVTDDIRAGRIGSLLNLWGAEQIHAMQRLAMEESRLRIPLLFGFDVLHGLRTIFPIPLAEACLFDPVLWEQTARAAAEEAAREGISITFAPMLDVTRDPRWGRIAEGPGEDPWLACRFGEAKTRGFQGTDLACANSLAATAKHFGANGAPIAGRDYASADVSERSLHEVYMPPFEAAVKAGVAAVMPALNDVAGVATTVNGPLLRGWLRERLGFEGVLISDYNAVAELLNHGVARDLAEAAALALKAGIDIDMMSDAYRLGLPAALECGLVAVEDIDATVWRVLKLKERLGLFDDPFRRGGSSRAGDADVSQRRQLARKVARRAIVPLTLKNDILPLSSSIKRIALVGPLAAAADEMIGPWASAAPQGESVSILEGLRAALPDCEIVTAQGVDIAGTDTSGIPTAVELCQTCELIILCVGEGILMSGEAHSRADIGLPGCQRRLAEAILDLKKPVVAILSSGRPLTLPWLFERAEAVLASWFLGTEAGHAVADVICGHFNPTGKLPVTWPRHVGQVPIFYNARPTGRPATLGGPFTSTYIDMPETPEFCFGHGLSYSHFRVENLICARRFLGRDETLDISVTVSNESSRDGEATVFLFIRDLVASTARPVLELKGVNKIALRAGERGQVCWSLPVAALACLGPDLQPVVEPGEFRIYVGQSADEKDLLSTLVTVSEASFEPPNVEAQEGLKDSPR